MLQTVSHAVTLPSRHSTAQGGGFFPFILSTIVLRNKQSDWTRSTIFFPITPTSCFCDFISGWQNTNTLEI